MRIAECERNRSRVVVLRSSVAIQNLCRGSERSVDLLRGNQKRSLYKRVIAEWGRHDQHALRSEIVRYIVGLGRTVLKDDLKQPGEEQESDRRRNST